MPPLAPEAAHRPTVVAALAPSVARTDIPSTCHSAWSLQRRVLLCVRRGVLRGIAMPQVHIGVLLRPRLWGPRGAQMLSRMLACGCQSTRGAIRPNRGSHALLGSVLHARRVVSSIPTVVSLDCSQHCSVFFRGTGQLRQSSVANISSG